MNSKVNFRISSGLKSIIGRDLITSDFIAIFELVKNSFDAGAQSVQVVFDLSTPGGVLYIVDDGKGMSLADIEKKWLFLAYSAKKDGTEDGTQSPKRNYAGNKGVGRFSSDRLGRYLDMEAKVKSEATVNVVHVDWQDFEKNSKLEFEKIHVTLDEGKKFNQVPNINLSGRRSGVVLRISQLRDIESWTRDKFIELKRALMKFIDPFNGEMSGKRVELICKEQEDEDAKESEKVIQKGEVPTFVNGLIENKVFDLMQSRSTMLKARISGEKLCVDLIDRNIHIYSTEENIVNKFPMLFQSDFNCSIAYLNRAAKVFFTRSMGIPPVQYGSLFLLRNGFRVMPVGDTENDYWGMNLRKQQGYSRYLGSREIFGYVSVTDNDENNFKEASSRDNALILTPAVNQLRGCVMDCLRKLEAYVGSVAWTDANDQSEESSSNLLAQENNKAKVIKLVERIALSEGIAITYYNKDIVSIFKKRAEEFQDIVPLLRNIAEKIKDTSLLKQVSSAENKLRKMQEELRQKSEIAQEEQAARQRVESQLQEEQRKTEQMAQENEAIRKDYEEERKRSFFLASSENRDKDVLEGFLHQIKINASAAEQSIDNAIRKYAKNDSIDKKLRELLFEQQTELEKIKRLAEFATFGNFRLDAEKTNGNICVFIEEYAKNISSAYNNKVFITCTRIDDVNLVMEFNPMEVGVLIDNLVNNSQKAGASRLVITMCMDKHDLIVTFVDDGHGLGKMEEPDRIFEKGFTRTKGSGIGLYFCRQVLSTMNSEILLAQPQPNKGASFIVRIIKNEA